MGRGRRSRWILLVALALLVSVFEMLGAGLVFGLIGYVGDPAGAMDLPLVGDVRPLFPETTNRAFTIALVLAVAVFFAVRGALQIVNTYVQRRVAENAGVRLSAKLFASYLSWPYAIHLDRNSASLIRNAQNAVQQTVSQVFVPMIRVAADTILLAGMVAVLIAVSPEATALAIGTVGGVSALVLLVVQPRLKRVGRTAHRMNRVTLQWLQESLRGIRDITVLGRRGFFEKKYRNARFKLARANTLRATWLQAPATAIESALIGFILLFIAVASLTESLGAATLPVLGVFAYVGFRLQPTLKRILHSLNDIRFASAPLDEIIEDLELSQSLPDPEDGGRILELRDELELEEVVLTYPGTEEPVLTGIDLTIRFGEQVGFCGPTGGGKTSLVDVIAGLLQPDSGRVTIDGTDLRGNERAWHRSLGVVSQTTFLIDDTLRNNIALGVPLSEIDEEALQEAIRIAQLHDFVGGLPMGLDTTIGEAGVRISGGQRQRIAIARALYRRPSLIIFDEATSALDVETEAKLMKSINELRGSRTVLLVAHRLSTIRDCDRVVLVEDGQITGVGKYEELEAKNKRFRAFVAQA